MMMLFEGLQMERTGLLGCWGWREGDISCDGLQKEMELVVHEVWRMRHCLKNGGIEKGVWLSVGSCVGF